ncbi:MAG: tetratricopeptide repeat protein [Balneolaceae bacterium]
MKYFLFFYLSLISIETFGFQNADSSLTTRNSSVEIQNLKIDQVQKDLERLSLSIDKLDSDIGRDLESTKNDVEKILNRYSFIALGIITIFGFLLNWIGKEAIKKWAKDIVSISSTRIAEEKVNETIKSKITDQLIKEAIKDKVTIEVSQAIESMTKKADEVFHKIETKGNALINNLAVLPSNSENDLNASEDDKKAIKLFNLAYSSNTHNSRITLYRKALELKPDLAPAFNNIAVSYFENFEFDKAVENALRAIKIDSSFVYSYAILAESYTALEEYDNALLNIEKVIKLNPDFPVALSIKGEIVNRTKGFHTAIKLFDEAVSKNPEFGEVYYRRGYFYYKNGKYKASLKDYVKAEELNFERKGLLYNNMAVSFRMLKDYSKAFEYVEKSLSLENFDHTPNTYGTLALIYADKEDEENFFKFLTIALDKGCKAWLYLDDSGFDKYRETERLNTLLEAYKG